MRFRRILSLILIAVMATSLMPTMTFAATETQSGGFDDPTYRPDHHMPFVSLNDAGNAVVLNQNKSWATRVYWGNIGDEYIEYKWFDDHLRLPAGTDYVADFTPREGEVYNFTKPGWYRFIVKAIRTGTTAEDYTYSELLFDFYYDGKVAPTVPSITELENNQVRINYNGAPVKKFYYGNIGDVNVPYSWFNSFWGTALATNTYTSVFDTRDGRIITLQTKGYYNIVIVLNDGTEYVYTTYAKNHAPVIKKVEGEKKAVIDIDCLKGNVGTKATLTRLYYGYVGTEDVTVTTYAELRAAAKSFVGDASPVHGKTYNMGNEGYYKFLVIATLSNGRTIEIMYTIHNSETKPEPEPEEPETPEITGPTFTVSNVKTTAGKTGVEVVVNAKNNPGVAGMTLSVEYDDTVLTLKKVSTGDVLSGLTFQKPKTYKNGCNLVWYGSEPNDVIDGETFVMTFDVAGTIPAGTYPIKLTYTEGTGMDLSPVEFSVVNGSIIIP